MKDHIVEISGEKGDFVPQAQHLPVQIAVSTSVTSPVGLINDSQQDGGIEGYRISLDGVFLPIANINIPYETIFTSWQDAFSKYLTMSEAEFYELLPNADAGKEDKSAEYFLNLTLQQIVEEPIDPVLEKALEIKQAVSDGGVDSLARVFEFAAENYNLKDEIFDKKIISVAQTLQFSPPEFASLSILQPLILFPDDPSPSAPSQTFTFGEPNAGNALIPEISEIYLNTYQAVEIRGNLFASSSPFGYTIGADYGPGAGPGFISASFSADNIAGGSLTFPVAGEMVFTTADGNVFTFFTANVLGHVAGDFIYTLINPISTPSESSFIEHFLYGITNNFNNTAVGNLNYIIQDDVPVTHDRTAPQLNESEISLLGSSQLIQPEISAGTLLTTFNPTGTLVISPDVPFNPVLPNAATDNYFGGDGGSVTSIVLDSVTGATGVSVVSYTSSFITGTELAYFTAFGLVGSSVGEPALVVNLSNGNSLIIDTLTAEYVLILNSAIYHTVADTIASLIFKYTFTDTDGDTSISSLIFNVDDDNPLAYNTTNSIDETALFVKLQTNPSDTETTTGNILTDGATDSVFGADGGKINSITVGNVTDNTTKTITDNGAGDLDPTVGSIEAETKYGTIKLDTEGTGVGEYTYTLDETKTVTAPDANLTADDVIGFELKDGDNSVASANLTVTVDLNQAPTAEDDLTYSTFENSSLTVLAASGVLANDTDPDAGDTKQVNSNTAASLGTLEALNNDGSFTYNPDNPLTTFDYLAAGESEVVSFTYTMKDAEGLVSNVATVNITVNGVNDAPEGTDNTVVVLEDDVYTFSAADFGFTDPIDGTDDALLSVKITTLPDAGTLLVNGSAFVAGTFISIADINAGFLTFTPVADDNGTNYANFTFQVQDDGGTANGGVDLDQSANTIQIDVTSVNDAPSGADKTVSTLEDTAKTFTAADFGFSDVNDAPNNFQSIFITALPGVGTGTLSIASGASVPAGLVTVGQEISVADIPFLTYTPTANANGTGYASFDFKVKDDGLTANGGIDTDPTANKITIDVTSVNDAPSGADKTVSTLEDTAKTFTAADFGFSDTNDAPNIFQSIFITALPGVGTGILSIASGASVPAGLVTVGQEISVADIPFLTYTPTANANGTGYASFDFKVKDDGLTANGGIDTDPTANTITIDVTPVNDAPDGADKTVTILEDGSKVFTAADFGFTDASDAPSPNSLQSIFITAIPSVGSLFLAAGASVLGAVTNGQEISLADIAFLTYTPAANANGTGYASFDFTVKDNGLTANGGIDTDPTANTITIDVTPVNDAPQIANAGNDVSYIPTAEAVVIDNDISVSDIDNSNLSGAVIKIENYFDGDLLGFIDTTNITGNYDDAGMLTLTGSATLTEYLEALQSITYSSANVDPTDSGNNIVRNISWVVDDGQAVNNLSVTANSTVSIIASPIILDLTGDGINLLSSSQSDTTVGDINGNDSNLPIGWFGEGNGVLMLDEAGTGELNSVKQISFASYLPGAQTDLQGLVHFDTNHDGMLDIGDNQFNQFGVLEANGKFETLSQLNITSISLTSDNHKEMMNGNTIFGFTTYETADGKSYQAADVGLMVGPASKGDALHTNDILPEQNQIIDLSKVPEPAAPLPALANDAHAVTAASTPSAVETSVVAPPVITEHLPQTQTEVVA
ncbi:MAG: cadherin-like domain-containing protein [Gammaproteobacteria bacterium]|nr:cadherin-like domain-containing protein [Gammaproteobacteria bacterium]